jgi:transglutaminase-like putative cysteine protease
VSSQAALRTAEERDVTLSLPAARGVAFAGLATFGALHWMSMLEPAAGERALYAVLAAGGVIAGLLAAGRLHGRARTLAATAVALAGAAAALLGGGVADELLRPDRWGDLAAAIGRGIESLPGARVPYRGIDQWTRTVIGAGGTALTVLAALVAFWPRGGAPGLRNVSLILLVALYVVPAVALDFGAEFLRGAVLAVLVLAYLRLETLRVSDTGAAAALAVGMAVAGLIAAPALDKDEPWWDYETWALTTASAKTTQFSWDHTYGPLDWPRDGRELLRVKAAKPAYWKAANLDDFDGRAWTGKGSSTEDGCDIDGFIDPESRDAWMQEMSVSVRNLRSPLFVTAGIACEVRSPRLARIPLGDGTYATVTRNLRRGDAYKALVYTPAPTERQRRAADGFYPDVMHRYTTVVLPGPGPDPRSQEERSGEIVQFGVWGEPLAPTTRRAHEPWRRTRPAERALAASAFARTWRLARELRSGAATQDEFVLRVERYLGRGFAYSESPPPAASTLEGFLFDAKSGYCQQFSGAMALLLRMGGVPARVSTGFTAGSYDRKAREYVVRDLDAHSWVEAWYPGIGWVTFDPTPAASPARSQPDEDGAGGAAAVTGRAPNLGGDIRTDPSRRAEAAGAGTSWTTVAAIGLAGLGALLCFAAALVQRRRRGLLGPLAELERALRRTRRTPGPGTTLSGLESRFARSPAAAGYVRALREQRYGGRPAVPTGAQRRALRSELARGAGLAGRLRAWWAMPPHPRRPRLH